MNETEKAREIVREIYTWGINKEGQSLSIKECRELATISIDRLLLTRPGCPYPHEVGAKVIGIVNMIGYPVTYWTRVKEEIQTIEL